MIKLSNLKERIKKKAWEIGFVETGFVKARKFKEYEDTLLQLSDKGRNPPFVTDDVEKRTNPFLIMEDCKTIISLAVSYTGYVNASLEHPPNQNQGYITPSAWGEDYHKKLEKMMGDLIDYINSEVQGNHNFIPFVDTGPLSDRHIATLAGIGFCGKNTNLITLSAGSFVWLGHILTNIAIEADAPLELSCGSCRKCIDSCPVQAIKEKGGIDYNKCLANQLIQKEASTEVLKKAENRVYGCDTCQLVCSFNSGVKKENNIASPEWIDLNFLLSLSNKKFRNNYGLKAFGWRGKKVLQRNAESILSKRN
ncbi:tRNA epoxyqueuosine(34) reductase QueG [Proteinivorax tanatarense]|uniref:tRNA epoxyqueuosine(34) reductase QueG n=1 Tax=Proteinivorax tanatarense TaxID=1260629 RepID=A0AAU7VIK8_9FIRM